MRLFSLPPLPQPQFLPMTRPELDRLGWEQLDVLLISGDAYVDHPSFAMAMLGRMLVAHGFRTGVITQPDWTSPDSLTAMGRPRLFAGVSAGAIDSMLAHYTAFRKKRSEDAYTPGGRAGARPNRAAIVYANLLRRAFPGLPIVLGGIEASLRRVSHYDFWTNALRKPIVLDAKADLVVYGMGERAVIDIACRLDQGADLHGIPGTVAVGDKDADITLPSHEEILAAPRELMRATLMLEAQVHHGRDWARQTAGTRTILIAPPATALSTEEMDAVYALPYTRRSHPSYTLPIPAEAMIRDSVTSHRGCGGGCSFCTLALHQGRRIASRSSKSILAEVAAMAADRDFKGQISDVGGPSANMWGAVCRKTETDCKRSSCMTPTICPHFDMDQQKHLDLLRRVRRHPGIRGVRVASGMRFDLALRDMAALTGYLREFVGGQLKIAPEHTNDRVLALMRKPGNRIFEDFLTVFERESQRADKEQYVVPYLMSAFPGTTDDDMRQLAAWLAVRGWKPRQVQCFIPIPGAVATAMFHAGITPGGKPIYVARTDEERLRQHRILIPEEGKGGSRTPASKSSARPKAEKRQQPCSSSGRKVARCRTDSPGPSRRKKK